MLSPCILQELNPFSSCSSAVPVGTGHCPLLPPDYPLPSYPAASRCLSS